MSTFVAVTDPLGAESAGNPVPHRCFLEIEGHTVHGLFPFERKFHREHGRERAPAVLQAFANAVASSPKAGAFGRFTWVAE